MTATDLTAHKCPVPISQAYTSERGQRLQEMTLKYTYDDHDHHGQLGKVWSEVRIFESVPYLSTDIPTYLSVRRNMK